MADAACAGPKRNAALRENREPHLLGFLVKRLDCARRADFGALAAEVAVADAEVHHRGAKPHEAVRPVGVRDDIEVADAAAAVAAQAPREKLGFAAASGRADAVFCTRRFADAARSSCAERKERCDAHHGPCPFEHGSSIRSLGALVFHAVGAVRSADRSHCAPAFLIGAFVPAFFVLRIMHADAFILFTHTHTKSQGSAQKRTKRMKR